MEYGKKVWLIADGFWDSHSTGLYPSHESVCALNTTDKDADITITLFFEDREKMAGFCTVCKAGRTHHIRMDRLKNGSGEPVPVDVPYAMLVESSQNIVVQYSRLNTAQCELAMMSTIAYPVE